MNGFSAVLVPIYYGNGEASERIKIPLYGSSVLPRCGSHNIDKSRDFTFLSRRGQIILLCKSKQTYIYLTHSSYKRVIYTVRCGVYYKSQCDKHSYRKLVLKHVQTLGFVVRVLSLCALRNEKRQVRHRKTTFLHDFKALQYINTNAIRRKGK